VFRLGQGTQGQNALYDTSNLGIDGDETFGMQFAQGDVKRPLIRSELP
jgi:hypothetical protein